jgi:gliding motility-associated-like protein
MHNSIVRFSKSLKAQFAFRFYILLSISCLFSVQASTLNAAELRAHPSSIVFNTVQGRPITGTRSVFIYSTPDGNLNWTQSIDVPWLSGNIGNGGTSGVLLLTVNVSGLAVGTYQGHVTLQSPQSTGGPVVINVSLIINPNVPVSVTTWKDGFEAAMSISIDSRVSGFDILQTYGVSGTYFYRGSQPDSYLTDFYNAGMEIGSHTINHHCDYIPDDDLRHVELEPNILAICTYTPQPCRDVISFAWPCGNTNYRQEGVTAEYFLSSRGYNINELEDATPDNLMNLKSYNSHEHTPYPPADLRTVIDQAILQKKWFNMVWHELNETCDVDVSYAKSQNIWIANIGTVIKYIFQRDRFLLANYTSTSDRINCNVSRLQIPSSIAKNFEEAFGTNDLSTLQIDIDDSKDVLNVLINGTNNPFQTRLINGNKVILTNVRLEPGIYKSVEVNYLNQSTHSLTISGVTANNKVYDRTTSATLNIGSAALVGVISGDIVTLNSSAVTGTFADRNAANGKLVTISGFTLGGADAAKYILIQPSASANITPALLTVIGVTADNRQYNGTTFATLNTSNTAFVGLLGPDVVTLNSAGASGTFNNKNVGTAKTVIISGLTISGAVRQNYTLLQPSATADITIAELTVSGILANDKTFDATTTATLNNENASLEGVFGSDDVTLVTTDADGSFQNINIGINKLVYTSGFTIEGPDSDNYTLTQPVTHASIFGLYLNITGVTANNRVYNGTTSTTLNTSGAQLAGVVSGDIVTLNSSGASGTFDNKNVGNSKTVSISGFVIGGRDAFKYSLVQPSVTANITRFNLTISGLTAANKVYNGSLTASLNRASAYLTGVFSGDAVTLNSTSATGTFLNKDVGVGKTVNTSGFALAGADAANYTISQPSLTADITPAILTVSGLSVNPKVYDRTTAANLNTGSISIAGVVGTEIIHFNYSGAVGNYTDKNAGTGKTVITSGFSIDGSGSGNYTLTQPTLTGIITGLSINVSGVTARDKIYDGSLTASINTTSSTLSGVLNGDAVVLLSTGASGSFESKNAGNGKKVNTSGFLLGGSDALNYVLIQPSATATITKAGLTVTGVTARDKIYDATESADLNLTGATLTGVMGSDVVHILTTSAAGRFAGKDVGAGKTVTATGFEINGADTENYSLSQPILSASISPKPLIITANNISKFYRATLTFTNQEFTASGLMPGDVATGITINSPGAVASAVVGNYTISVTGGTNRNYSYSYVNGLLTVKKATITARADDKTKFYGAGNPSLSISYSGFINNEDPSVIDLPPVVSTTANNLSNSGIYPITISGGNDNNYNIELVNGIMTILKAPLTIRADDKTRKFRETNPSFTIVYSGFVLGQDAAVLDVTPVPETDANTFSDAGEYEIRLTEAVDPNYSFIYLKGILKIDKVDQIITFEEIPDKLRMTQQQQLRATASSGLPVHFESSDQRIGSIVDDVLKINRDGSLTLRAIQEGDINWNAAPAVSQTITALPTFSGISSLFTPNNDGMNDLWYIPDLEQFGKLEVTVYNRFGQTVYQSDSYKNDWDGTWKGSPLPSASYYYIIKSSAKGFIKGVVNIAR